MSSVSSSTVCRCRPTSSNLVRSSHVCSVYPEIRLPCFTCCVDGRSGGWLSVNADQVLIYYLSFACSSPCDLFISFFGFFFFPNEELWQGSVAQWNKIQKAGPCVCVCVCVCVCAHACVCVCVPHMCECACMCVWCVCVYVRVCSPTFANIGLAEMDLHNTRWWGDTLLNQGR